jgi:hypothetical protein
MQKPHLGLEKAVSGCGMSRQNITMASFSVLAKDNGTAHT